MRAAPVLLFVLFLSAWHPRALGQSAAFTCSPAPCVLPPVQASEGGNPVTAASIAANPLNPKQLLLGAQDTNCPSGLGFPQAFYTSNDGGSTWGAPACMGPVPTYSTCCYPTTGYDRNGVAYAVGDYSSYSSFTLGLLAFQKSTDGVTWGKPAVAISGWGYYNWSRLGIDTNRASPYLNNVYISATLIHFVKGNAGQQLIVTHSRDGGASWTMKAVTPFQTALAEDAFSSLATGRDGTVYLTWQHCTANCYGSSRFASMMFSKSTDGGSTWSAPMAMAKVTLAPDSCNCSSYGYVPNTSARVSNFPVVGVDNSSGPHAGSLYVVMYNWTGTYMQVQVIHSTDSGATWSKPVPVAPTTATHDQFFPWLAVSAGGNVGVSWLDRRNDPANLSYQAFAAVSSDGGASFGNNWQLTSAFSNPLNDGSGGTYLGDYTGNTWAGSTLYAAWMDTSNGVNSQIVVGGLRLH